MGLVVCWLGLMLLVGFVGIFVGCEDALWSSCATDSCRCNSLSIGVYIYIYMYMWVVPSGSMWQFWLSEKSQTTQCEMEFTDTKCFISYELCRNQM